jgi:hypothetical protein
MYIQAFEGIPVDTTSKTANGIAINPPANERRNVFISGLSDRLIR